MQHLFVLLSKMQDCYIT